MKRLVLAVALLGCGGEREETAQEQACSAMADDMCQHLAECEAPSWALDCRQKHRDWCVHVNVPAEQARECGAGFKALTCERVLSLAIPPACEF